MSESTIRSLPLWRGELVIEPLPGGLTNHNYRVVDGGLVYAVRTGADDLALGISRRNELACTENAARLGIAPRIAYAVPGVLVSEFVTCTTLTPDLLAEPARLERAAAAIRAIHQARDRVTGHLLYFCPFQVARTYLAYAQDHSLELPGLAPEALTQAVDELCRCVGPFTPTFCHNDMMPGNLLETDQRLWVIDWEYAGIGHPLFDLAGLSSNCDFDDATDRVLLRAYGDCGEAPSEFRVFKAMAALRESLWAVIQSQQSSIDFDYLKYRDDNYHKFLRYKDAAI